MVYYFFRSSLFKLTPFSPSIGKVEVIKSPRAKYVFIPKDVNDPGHVYLFHYRSKATLDQLLTKTGSTNHALTETAQTSILPTDEPLAVDVATVGTSIANVPPGTPASGLEYILQNPGKTIGNHNLRSHARRVGLGSNVDDTLKTHQSKPKRKGYSTLSDTIISQRSSHSRATKRARIDYASPETDEDEIEEEEDEKKEKEGDKLYTPNRSRIRRQQPRKQKVICDDTDDDEDSNIEAIARMRRQMEAEAAQHHDEAGPLEQATNVPANSRRRLRVPAVKIEAVDLTGVESTGPVNTEPRIARRAQATAPTMTSSDLEKQLHLLELKTREAKFERQRFELKLQLEKAEREDN
ncbi:hypothetical protein BLS_001730 [Venturia inaequalis]|uniref:Uncharacterized protein n=1 Tax=Venturia inaequalis TaxID=5025 RepID=A0A8H3YL20_VENIN|nr:hypothetical protein BLS_001730 [Venturia inaequalis]